MKTLIVILTVITILTIGIFGTAESYRTDYSDYSSSSYSSSSDRQLLSEIKALTFYAGRKTTGRRSAPMDQLVCVGGNACGRYTPSVVLCQQVGDEQWRCEADLPNNLRFGSVTVSCEGYASPDDEYVLKGSCGLEYSLEATSNANSYSNGYPSSSNYFTHNPQYEYGGHSSSSSFGSVVTIVVVLAIGLFLWNTCNRTPNQNGGGAPAAGAGNYGTGFNPGGGGGGGGYGGGYGGGPSCAQPGASSGPGFYSGMAAGGLMGYLFGNRRAGYSNYGYSRPYAQPGYGMGGGGGSMFGGGGSSFGGGGTRTAFSAGGTRRR